jgi:hypothetical protein
MTGKNQNCETYLRLVRAATLLVPKELRSGWRREWEAEVINRWQLLVRWERLNARTKFDLFKRLQGAWLDALWFQQRRTHLVLVILNMLVAALTAFGAVQEFIVRVILDYKTQPFLLSLAGIVVSVLFLVSGIAMLRQWHATRQLIIATSTLSIALHVYGALPPHRNMGYGALLVGAGYGLLMLLVFEWNRRRNLVL